MAAIFDAPWWGRDVSGWVWVLADAAAKGVLLLGAAGLVAVALRRASAAARHMVWFVALAGVLVLPVLSAALPSWRLPALPRAASSEVERTEPAAPSERPALPVPSPAAPAYAPLAELTAMPPVMAPAETALPAEAAAVRAHWSVWALGASAVGTAALLCYLLAGTVCAWQIARAARPVAEDSPWRRATEGLRWPGLRLLESERVAGPMMWGLLRPFVLLPADTEDWSDERRRVVLLHELAHLERHDCWTQALAQIACAFYWFNPLAWVAARRMRIERERACDDRVLAAGLRASSYADHLLQIARTLRGLRCGALGAVAMAPASQLEGRLLAILDPKRSRRRLTLLMLALALLAAACILPPLAAARLAAAEEPPVADATEPAEHGAVAAEPEPEEAVTEPSWQATLPNGVTVEFVGVSYHPSEGQPWWRPDGSPLAEAPDDRLSGRLAGPVTREFAIRLSNIPKGTFEIRVRSPQARAAVRGSISGDETASGSWGASFPEGVESCSVQVGVATGSWDTLARSYGEDRVSVGLRDGGLVFGEAEPDGNGTRISVSHDLRDLDVRIVAIDKTGRLHTPASVTTSIGGRIIQPEAFFRDLALEQVEEFRVQTRLVQWVTFRNVSLEAGHRTALEVVAEGVGAPADAVAAEPEPEEAVAASPWQATLPNGVTVELIGLSYHPSEGKAWWRPDGTPLQEAPYDEAESRHLDADIELAFRFRGGTDDVATRLKVEGADGWGSRGPVFRAGEEVAGLRAFAIRWLAESTISTSVGIGVASGGWTTRVRAPGNVGLVAPDGRAHVSLRRAGSDTFVSVADTFVDLDCRVVALDTDGELRHPVEPSMRSDGELRQTTARFRDLPLERIAEVRFETRSYEWAEFRNVSLEPGHKTNVEVVVEGQAAEQVHPAREVVAPEPTTPTFGPVIELVLRSAEGREAELVDLETGRRAVHRQFGANDRETHRWVRERKVDVLGVLEKGMAGVFCFDMAVVPVNAVTLPGFADQDWEDIPAQAVVKSWLLNQTEPKPITPIGLPEDGTPPAYLYLFETREGSKGLLRIVGATEDGTGVTIRYKMVQGVPGGAVGRAPDRLGGRPRRAASGGGG